VTRNITFYDLLKNLTIVLNRCFCTEHKLLQGATEGYLMCVCTYAAT